MSPANIEILLTHSLLWRWLSGENAGCWVGARNRLLDRVRSTRWADMIQQTVGSTSHNALHTANNHKRWKDIMHEKILPRDHDSLRRERLYISDIIEAAQLSYSDQFHSRCRWWIDPSPYLHVFASRHGSRDASLLHTELVTSWVTKHISVD